jgi:hypothetical protein
MADTTKAEKAKDFQDSPSGWARRLQMEMDAAHKRLEPFHEQGRKTVDYYLDKRSDRELEQARLGIFTSNVDTLKALLYGKTPQTDVSRRNNDADDDEARVAADMLERMLNSDIAKDSDSYSSAIRNALEDRLLPGFGFCKVRYDAEFEDVPAQPAMTAPHPMTGELVELAPEVPATKRKTYECVEVDYVPWRDVRWGSGRTFHEVPWFGFAAQMTVDEAEKKFGAEVADDLPKSKKRDDANKDATDPWDRITVWEIWHKESRSRFFWVDGYGRVIAPLDVQANANGSVPDPLELEGFWPFPEPMVSHASTTAWVPKSDFVIHQYLYKKADALYHRITELEDALRVVGLYDESSPEIKKLLSETNRNTMNAVKNWAAFKEGGGAKGSIEWFPLEMVVGAIQQLTMKLNDTKALIYEATGMSDIMRGQAAASATATEQSIKAKFASVRMQALQDEFARFASDVLKLKGEIIARWFDPETIISQSNIQHTADAQFAPAAVQLIKSEFAKFRIQVKPENISLTDYAALKAERTEVVTAVGGVFQSLVPAIQMGAISPDLAMQFVKFMIAGLKGASTMESVLDAEIAKLQQQQQQKAAMAAQAAQQQAQQGPPPDPRMQQEQFKAQARMQQEQFKGQAQMQHTQAELQADLIRTKAETQADLVRQGAQHQFNLREAEHAQQLQGVAAVNQLIPGAGGQQ